MPLAVSVAAAPAVLVSLATKPALANVPIWVTENNVNADFDGGGGISACNGTPFVSDHRGSSDDNGTRAAGLGDDR